MRDGADVIYQAPLADERTQLRIVRRGRDADEHTPDGEEHHHLGGGALQALGELLEPAHLRHVQLAARNVAGVVQAEAAV